MIPIPVWLLTTKAKLIGAGILLAGLWWYHHHAMAKVYSEAAQVTTEKLLKTQSEEVDRKVAELTSQLALERTELDAQRIALSTERTALSGQRRQMNQALEAGIARLSTENVGVIHEIQAIPDDAVNGRFREALARARRDELERSDGEAVTIRSIPLPGPVPINP